MITRLTDTTIEQLKKIDKPGDFMYYQGDQEKVAKPADLQDSQGEVSTQNYVSMTNFLRSSLLTYSVDTVISSTYIHHHGISFFKIRPWFKPN